MKIHPACQIYPLMDDTALRELADDIRHNGLKVPVLVDPDGRVVDGRNRLAACKLAGIDPVFKTVRGDDNEILQLVISLNDRRRHLTTSQRAAAAALADELMEAERERARERQKANLKHGNKSPVVENLPPRDSNGKTRDTIGEKFRVSGRSVDKARTIRTKAPEVFAEVHSGKKTLNQATLEIKKQARREEQKEKAKAAEFLDQAPSWSLICQEVLDGLRSVASNHPQPRLIFTDPPYNIGIDYGNGSKADKLDDSEYMKWVGKWIGKCHNLLTDDGSLWVMIGDEYAAEYNLALKSAGFTIRSWIKWYETFGVNCVNGFNRTSRHIFYAVKSAKRFVFNADAVSRASDRQTKYNDKRASADGKVWDDVWGINPPLPRLTQTCNERLPDFPTQLPIALVKAVVECASDPGDLVVDPFNGSGTTGVACIKTNRKYIGIDQSERFIELATERLRGTKA